LFLIGYGREYPLPKVGGGLEWFNYRFWKLTPTKKIKKFLGQKKELLNIFIGDL
jgi:hypothetical protein